MSDPIREAVERLENWKRRAEKVKDDQAVIIQSADRQNFIADLSAILSLVRGVMPRPIEEIKSLDENTLIIAINSRGQRMIWKVSLLLHARQERTPTHLQFDATHFTLLDALPLPQEEPHG